MKMQLKLKYILGIQYFLKRFCAFRLFMLLFVIFCHQAFAQLPDHTDKFKQQLHETRAFFTYLGCKWKGFFPVKLCLFFYYTNTGSYFDLKHKGWGKKELGIYSMFNGYCMRYDDYGNYNFGAAARAMGLSLGWAKLGAGINQLFPGEGVPDFSNWSGFFDNRNDTHLIELGYHAAYE
jgi:hypothetical protein